MRALPFVKWANSYMVGFKISPRLYASTQGGTARMLDLKPLAGSLSKDVQLVDVVLHRGADAAAAVASIAAAAGLEPDSLKPSGGKFRLRVANNRLAALASLDDVRHIEPVFEKKLFNNVALKLMRADTVHSQGGLLGQGEVVAICDTGLDMGSTSNVHPAFAGRVAKIYALGRASGSDPDGHGTHVCGSAVGDGNSASLGRIQGSAPAAQLVMQSVLDSKGGLGGLPDDLTSLFTMPYQHDGARVATY